MAHGSAGTGIGRERVALSKTDHGAGLSCSRIFWVLVLNCTFIACGTVIELTIWSATSKRANAAGTLPTFASL